MFLDKKCVAKFEGKTEDAVAEIIDLIRHPMNTTFAALKPAHSISRYITGCNELLEGSQ